MKESGLRAFIGKLSMDTSTRPSYVEPSAQASLDSATSFVEKCYALDESKDPRLIEPILTPRFVPTCSDSLLRDLGGLAAQGRNSVPLRIQSHLAESEDQVAWVKSTRHADDIDVFDKVRSPIHDKASFILRSLFHTAQTSDPPHDSGTLHFPPSPFLGPHVADRDICRSLPAFKRIFLVNRDF